MNTILITVVIYLFLFIEVISASLVGLHQNLSVDGSYRKINLSKYNENGNSIAFETKINFEIDEEDSLIFNFQIDLSEPTEVDGRLFLRSKDGSYDYMLEIKDLLFDSGRVYLYYPAVVLKDSLLSLSNDKGDKDEFVYIFQEQRYSDLLGE